jgi:hypothetical protein
LRYFEISTAGLTIYLILFDILLEITAYSTRSLGSESFFFIYACCLELYAVRNLVLDFISPGIIPVVL